MVVLLASASCSSGTETAASTATTTAVAPILTDDLPAATVPISSADVPATDDITVATSAAPPTTVAALPPCETDCLLPWPNDRLTVADASTSTGRRLAIPADSTPVNADGVHIDVTDQNRADGFSPGSAIVFDAPDVDVDASGLAPSTDIGASLAPDAPIVITDTSTGDAWPYWAELDAQAALDGAVPDGRTLLLVHPAAALTEGHTFQVHVGTLLDTGGEPVDVTVTDWSFTVASAQSLAGRLLHMRDDAYASLGDLPPTFTVGTVDDDGSVRTIEGTVDVPNYLSGDGSAGSRMLFGDDGLPVRSTTNPTYAAPFRCVLPQAPSAPVPVIVYGHGLLNNRTEVDGLRFAAENGLAGACATDFIGMASDDIGNLVAILGDMSHFPEQADRMQQGLLNVQFLARAINDDRAFATSSAFAEDDGTPLIAPGQTQFVGNSQGGILGGAASAISTEWSRAVLGVPGMNYSLLLTRSSDWPEFGATFDAAYTGSTDRVMALQLVQLLWDRGENDGYAQHLTTDAYSGTTAKDVLLIEAFGDHQVANVSTEILARTIGAKVHEPSLTPGRSNDVDPQWGIEPIDNDGSPGPALVVWDYGTPAPPPVNLPPTEPEYGADPHGAGSQEPLVLQQAFTFLLTGVIDDACSGGPCISSVLTG